MKRCGYCGVVKPLTEFHRHPLTRDGVKGHCKPCAIEYSKADYARNREERKATQKKYRARRGEVLAEAKSRYRKENPARVQATNLRRYGMTLAEYEAMSEAQAGVCAICLRPSSSCLDSFGKPLHWLAVDHCHETARVRGLLCNRCNLYLARLTGDAAFMERRDRHLEADPLTELRARTVDAVTPIR